jgi:2-dehydro-3-deoxyphosphogluconate aldolase/(4S)-4-hydroxy-2-oxoglutarate aldolase
VPLARALLAGGVDIIEITFRTAAARQAIANIAAYVPEMTPGAGTVISAQQLAAATEAGARFIVSPGLDPQLVKSAQADGIVAVPGVVTPSELMAGFKLGLSVFKFFPAESFGGIKTVKALSAPFGAAQFIPTGGVNETNAAEYWRFPKVLAVGGSWIAPESLITARDFDTITRITADAVDLFDAIRGGTNV